jgi:hypothetical protein
VTDLDKYTIIDVQLLIAQYGGEDPEYWGLNKYSEILSCDEESTRWWDMKHYMDLEEGDYFMPMIPCATELVGDYVDD